MSQLQVFNTLSGKKEVFTPLNGKAVHIYACGPTVYDSPHLGHARMAVVWDVIVRYLRYAGYDVVFARNITDVDDKIINRARESGVRPEQLARDNTYAFWRDMRALNVKQPDYEPRATEYLGQMIAFIEKLIAKGHAYASSGDVYFDVASFAHYWQLKKQAPDEMLVGARELAVSQEDLAARKKSPLDFALWKGAPEGELGWPSPWGRGRPGWHLECSTMIKDVFGETIDIHGGGEDLVFPHNENELAQSQALHDKPLARYWMHNAMVNVNAEKMSKSLGNFKTIQDLLNVYSPDAIRLFVLQTHYKSPLEFSAEALKAVQTGLSRLVRAAHVLSEAELAGLALQNQAGESEFTRAEMKSFEEDFTSAMNNDFNTAEAVAVLYKIADKIFQESDSSRRLSYVYALNLFAGVLGLTLEDTSHKLSQEQAEGLAGLVLQIRQSSRQKKDFATSDLIRDELAKLGIAAKDTTGGGASWEVV